MRRLVRVACVLAVAMAIFAPVVYWRGGVIEIEALSYLPHYVNAPSLAHAVFDPLHTDFDAYQGRELSYLFDFVDAHAFVYLLRAGLIVFVPLSALATALAMAAIIGRAGPRYGWSAATTSLLLLLYFTSYVYVTTTGALYRSAKPVLSVVLVITALRLAALCRRPREPSWMEAAGVFALCAVMGTLDLQGIFYAIVTAGLLVIAARRGACHSRLPRAGAAALVFIVIYHLAIAPLLIYGFSGYVPNLEFEMLEVRSLLDPGLWRDASWLLLHMYSSLTGSWPVWIAGIMLAGVLAWTVSQRAWGLVGVLAAVLASQVVMLGMMMTREPDVYRQPDLRLWYYPLPTLGLALVGMLLVGQRWLAGQGRWRGRVLQTALLAGAIANVAHWPADWREVQGGRYYPVDYSQTRMLEAAIRTGVVPDAMLAEYREFYRFCVSLALSARP